MILNVNNLSFSYEKGEKIFEHLSFEVSSPEVFCILGPNGIGKSTLLKCLAGMHSPMEGEITFDGRTIEKFSRREFAGYVAYIPQNRTPSFSFSVLDGGNGADGSHGVFFGSHKKRSPDCI